MSIDNFLFLALGGEELLPEEILVSEEADSLLCFEVRVNDVIGAQPWNRDALFDVRVTAISVAKIEMH